MVSATRRPGASARRSRPAFASAASTAASARCSPPSVAAGAAAAARRGADGAGDRAVGDLDRRPGHRGGHQCRARVSRRAGGDARRECGAGRAARLSSRKAYSRRGTDSSRRSAASMARRAADRDRRAGRKLGHHHRHGDQAGARRPSVSRGRRGRGQCCARGEDRRGGCREHHHLAPRHDDADRPAASGRPDRHGAQPRLFRRRRRGRPRILLGPRECREDRGPGDPPADRPRAGGAPPTEDAARYRQGATVTIATHEGGVYPIRYTRRKARRRSGSTGATSMRNTALWCRWRGWANARSRQVSCSSTISGGSRMWRRWHGRCAPVPTLKAARTGADNLSFRVHTGPPVDLSWMNLNLAVD